jgi:transcriptional regulator with XRE-family HTH domain
MESINVELFQEKLEKLIKETNMSIKEINDTLEISDNALKNYRKGRLPKIEILYKITQLFGVDMNYFFTDQESSSEKYEYITKLLDQLDEKELIKMEGYIEDYFERIIDRRKTSSVSKDTG